jgi:hypothetical protein
MGLRQVVLGRLLRLAAPGRSSASGRCASPSLRLTITNGWKFSVSPLSNL